MFSSRPAIEASHDKIPINQIHSYHSDPEEWRIGHCIFFNLFLLPGWRRYRPRPPISTSLPKAVFNSVSTSQASLLLRRYDLVESGPFGQQCNGRRSKSADSEHFRAQVTVWDRPTNIACTIVYCAGVYPCTARLVTLKQTRAVTYWSGCPAVVSDSLIVHWYNSEPVSEWNQIVHLHKSVPVLACLWEARIF